MKKPRSMNVLTGLAAGFFLVIARANAADSGISLECPHSDLMSVEQAEYNLTSLFDGFAWKSRQYWPVIEISQREFLPKLYVLSMRQKELQALLSRRQALNGLEELAFDFHLALMHRSIPLLESVDIEYRRQIGLISQLSARSVHITEASPFLAPVALLDMLARTYVAALSGDDATFSDEFRRLEVAVTNWLGSTQTSPFASPRGGGVAVSATNAQMNAAWLNFHLGLLARRSTQPALPQSAARYFREAARFVSPSCQPIAFEVLNRLAADRPVCRAGSNRAVSDSAPLPPLQYPYFCAIADPNFPFGK